MPNILNTKRINASPIFIDTGRNAVTINKSIFSISIVDIFYANGNVQRDVLAPAYRQLITDLNPTSLQWPGGAITESATVKIGDTTINGGTGSGYNCALTNPGNPVCTFAWTKDFFNEFIELCKLTGIRPDVSFNCDLSDADFSASVDWILSRCNEILDGDDHQHCCFGMEANINNQQDYWKAQQAAYNVSSETGAYIARIADKLNAVRALYPNRTFHIVGNDVLKNTEHQVNWGNKLHLTYAGKNLSQAQAVKMYIQTDDLFIDTPFEFSELDFEYNLLQVNRVFDANEKSKYTVPNMIARFKQLHPGKKLGIWQSGWLNQEQTPVHHTMLALIYIAKFYHYIINYNYYNSDFITYCSYQNFKNILDNDAVPKNHYWGLWIVGKFLIGAPKFIPSFFDLPGLSGSTVYEPTGEKYRVLIINEGATDYPAITVNNAGTLNNSGNRYSSCADTLGSQTIFTETVAGESPFHIRPFSINVIEFDSITS